MAQPQQIPGAIPGTPNPNPAPQVNPTTPVAAGLVPGVPQHALGQYTPNSFASYNSYATPTQAQPTPPIAGGMQYQLPLPQPPVPQQNAAGFHVNNGPPIDPRTNAPYVSRFKKDFEEEKQRSAALEARIVELQNTVGEMQGRLLQSQAATAEAVRETEFEKRVAQAIGLNKADLDLQKLGGALAGAAAAAPPDARGKAVHFDLSQQGGSSDEDRKKKKGKDKKRKKSSKKKKKKHTSSDSDSSATGTSDSGSRRSRQREKRAKGASRVQATQSGSGHKGASTGTSPDPKGAALRTMLDAREAAYVQALASGLDEAAAQAAGMAAAFGRPVTNTTPLPIPLPIPAPTPNQTPVLSGPKKANVFISRTRHEKYLHIYKVTYLTYIHTSP
ncbi:hypothetical protein CYMTET_32473 [Cymbomonas tetramitiformis]|uniref:Uncharacterized protein n=1 Tax=Cymbomonas tetramitiformis TaxID=36881 RepID=A0AAE0KS69_9CHLO|nr:hypothetical protein CYMTET_32473 [Cymbomonas tetramitiformis]